MDLLNKHAAGPTSKAAVAKIKSARAGQTGMSYKFQRLREKLRTAVKSGELSGKLPGERALARRFHVNAKTLSKALTDLAAEGILDRSIGRGTYVKGSAPVASSTGRWLVLADPDDVESGLVNALRGENSELQVATSIVEMRPSFLNQFAAVIDMATNTPESFLRDLVVRNMPVVVVNREPRTYSMHAVLLDMSLGISRVGRELMLAGHRRLAAIEPVGSTLISTTLRHAISPFAANAMVDVCTGDNMKSLVESGVTAFVCGSQATARQARDNLEKAGVRVPAQVSLVAVAPAVDTPPCSGYFCMVDQLAQVVNGLLRDGALTRPAAMWLAGAWHDLGTTGPTAPVPGEDAARLRIG